MSTSSDSAKRKGPLDAAQKIVAELQGMPKDDQILALKFATETLKLHLSGGLGQPSQTLANGSQNVAHTPVVTPASSKDIKSFTAEKSPKSDQQFAAVVAYFFQFEAPAESRKDSIDAATMQDAARMAGRKQVNNWNATLNNALRTGYLDKAEQGSFKLNAVGENLVAMTLPDGAPSRNNNGGSKSKKKARKQKLTKKKNAITKSSKKKSSKAKKA